MGGSKPKRRPSITNNSPKRRRRHATVNDTPSEEQTRNERIRRNHLTANGILHLFITDIRETMEQLDQGGLHQLQANQFYRAVAQKISHRLQNISDIEPITRQYETVCPGVGAAKDLSQTLVPLCVIQNDPDGNRPVANVTAESFCGICSKPVCRKGKLTEHIQSQHVLLARVFTCPVKRSNKQCQVTRTSKHELRHHLRTKHGWTKQQTQAISEWNTTNQHPINKSSTIVKPHPPGKQDEQEEVLRRDDDVEAISIVDKHDASRQETQALSNNEREHVNSDNEEVEDGYSGEGEQLKNYGEEEEQWVSDGNNENTAEEDAEDFDEAAESDDDLISINSYNALPTRCQKRRISRSP